MTQSQKVTSRKFNSSVLAVILIAVGGGAFAWWVMPSQPPLGADLEASTTSNVSRLTVPSALVQAAGVSEVPRAFSGLVKPVRSSDLGFKRTGRLVHVRVDQGDAVSQGAVLAELDTDSLLADLANARAQLSAAQARLAELVAGPRRETIQAARAQVVDLTAQLNLAKTQFDRRTQLRNSGAISAQEYDDAKFQVAAAEGRLNVSASQLEELVAGTRQEQITAQQASVQQLEAAVSRLEVDIDESQLRAPYAAVVSKRMFDEGAVVPPGTVVLRLVESGSAEVWIGLPPESLRELSVGQIYPLSVDSLEVKAALKTVLPELDPATRTQTAIFALDFGDELSATEISFGQLARLHLTQTSQQNGFWIPTTALSRGQRGLWSLMVIQATPEQGPATGVIQRQDVEVLQVDSDRVLVRGTIQSGDRYVLSGIHRLTPGQAVSFADAEQAIALEGQ